MQAASNRRTDATTTPQRSRGDLEDALSSLLRDEIPSAPAHPPGAQLVLPGHPGQLGLDGRTYQVEAPAPTLSREAANRSLGPLHHVSHAVAGDVRDLPENADLPPAPASLAQLQLAPELFETAPQLSLWGRLRVSRDLLWNRTDSNRDAKCQHTRFATDGEVVAHRHASGAYTLTGVIACNRMTCPCCGPRRARSTCALLAVAMKRHHAADAFHDTWMLTLAPPHDGADPQSLTVERLYEARAELRRSAAWRAWSRAHGIVGTVRAFDATHGGAHGLHAHFHEALFVTRASFVTTWAPTSPATRRASQRTDEDFVDAMVRALTSSSDACMQSPSSLVDLVQPLRWQSQLVREAYLAELVAPLVDAWMAACVRAGIVVRDAAAFRRHAIQLSPSEKAQAYFTKWGLSDEVGAPTAKHNSHLRLLDICGAGGADAGAAGELYRAFREAVDGRAWVTGLADICKRYAVTSDDAGAYLAELRERRRAMLAQAGTPIVEVPPLVVEIWPHLFASASRLGWERVFAFVDEVAARGGDVQRELAAWLWRNLESAYVNAYRRRGLAEGMRAPPAMRDSPPDGTALRSSA